MSSTCSISYIYIYIYIYIYMCILHRYAYRHRHRLDTDIIICYVLIWVLNNTWKSKFKLKRHLKRIPKPINDQNYSVGFNHDSWTVVQKLTSKDHVIL